MYSAWFDFHGVKVAIRADADRVAGDLKRDFAYFITGECPPDISVEILFRPPPYETVPRVRASRYLPTSIVYDVKGKRYVDYRNRALTVYDHAGQRAQIYSADNDLLHEISYLLVLSRVGELLDRRGMHRIHGLALSVSGKAVLCLLPMGGGKTTLALELLKQDGIKLLSDEIILVDRSGAVLPFPMRLGIDKEDAPVLPPELLREFPRQRYGTKILLDIDHISGKVGSAGAPWLILIGERVFSDETKVEPMGRMSAFRFLFRDGVIGLGLPQVVEYFLRNGIRDLGKVPILFSRTLASLKLLCRSKVYRCLLGRDKKKNAETIAGILTKSHE
ncbi:MAG: hypothetical protein WC515_04060 [Candidatus Omnitrophota bacterium]